MVSSGAEFLPVRIWYTIDGSPQYILARSPQKFSVQPFPASTYSSSSSSQHSPTYATTSLKACLHTMCRSSPELMHYGARDFSLYVLDPTESDSAPSTIVMSSGISGPAESASCPPRPSQGVAVGMGLMSWALAAQDDNVSVTGTLVKLASGDRALEVIFALRGAPRIQPPQYFQPANQWQSQPMALPMVQGMPFLP
ncbi:hypothetical protein BV25DRAFT_801248 [Artomyces pyxidatus]|uniref:Uncharacterized protein n=1 Tax=Artomyces pyxidatus TaxID=48021 RepID=A0ACB8SYE5_9AGAM|nr:hypothetical protein BV25DRAFT_801248 [Artomyces pyxidatus]